MLLYIRYVVNKYLHIVAEGHRSARSRAACRSAVRRCRNISRSLKEAGLVSDRPEGTRRVYYIDPHGLGALRGWLDQFWDQALSAFQAEAERTPGSAGGGHNMDRER